MPPTGKDAIVSVTKAINGGLIGLADRKEWVKRTKFVWNELFTALKPPFMSNGSDQYE